MTNVARLIVNLESHLACIDKQSRELRDREQRFQRAWNLLRICYKGHGAEEFIGGFERACSMMNEYEGTLATMKPILVKRLEDLRRFDIVSGSQGLRGLNE